MRLCGGGSGSGYGGTSWSPEGDRGLHEWKRRRRRRERPELGSGARAGGCPGPALVYGGGSWTLKARVGDWAELGGAGPGGLGPEARRAGAGHDAPEEAKPPAAREMRGGQRSGVRGLERGGTVVGSVEWAQVWLGGGGLLRFWGRMIWAHIYLQSIKGT